MGCLARCHCMGQIDGYPDPVLHGEQVETRDELSNVDENGICVVSVIGKNSQNSLPSKASLITSVLSPQGPLGYGFPCDLINSDQKCCIECSYDRTSHVMYLHLQSIHDMKNMASICSSMLQNLDTQEGFDKFTQSAEQDAARALLFMFSVSHIILIHHPGSSFDVGYVKLFHILDILRSKLLSHLGEVLRSLHLPKDWVNAGRLCAPRVLFLFQSTLLVDDKPAVVSKGRGQKTSPVKRLQHAVEDQIYRILRKARIITNISNNSLFAVPANQEFVFINRENSLQPINFFAEKLTRKCASNLDDDSSYFEHQVPSGTPGLLMHSPNHPFREFLSQHIELALSKGFDDNMGRNPVPPVFESPSLKVWLEAAQAVHAFFFEEPKDIKAKAHFGQLHNLLHTNARFSEGRCIKVLPLAEKAYQEGLPHHYTQADHLAMLVQAKRVFMQHARGPACHQYLKQLEQDCTKFWENGHRMCEHQSLTGNPCTNELHRLPSDEETDDNAHLPEMEHCSQVKTRAACNCGRRQAEREDPFDYKTANFDWYEKQESSCCHTLDKHPLPTFTPTSPDSRAGGKIHRGPQSLGSPDSKLEAVSTALSHLTLSNGNSSPSLYQDEFNPEASQDQAMHCSASSPHSPIELDDSELCRQHSTVEYLAGMVHSDNPLGLLPKFSSWSIRMLSKSYNPSAGLDQPGFLHFTSYLLPWDIPTQGSDIWPIASKKYKQNRKAKVGSDSNAANSVRFYVGLEYECPRGHRFFMSGPEKIFKAPASGVFKETAHKILHHDMPLYFPCHCSRSGKSFMTQLMRLFVYVADTPLQIALNVRVQPAPPPSPNFHPHVEGPLALPPGLWVVRFPYVYYGDSVHYPMPSDAQQLSSCKLHKEFLTVCEGTPLR
ncbi:hypothetical protein CAPTEDRAFT_223495 [Capitella teleta]|uniref:Nonsense-mediated mRNA decay factor SMG8 n=1 Tax=Capitella teleta TaxID=283909 RepID=R7VIE9_CAPTE|nr:hypothetical protein CAPTEDRAFT_223495 [Capitella teleta]|eukprot:ELU16071.1 hypothetical protein CAPTEDRAFT_223495 [Capitella teleta]